MYNYNIGDKKLKGKIRKSRHQAKDFHEEATEQSKLYKSTCTKEQQNDCMCDLVFSSTSYPRNN
jgi:hypothetical protein